MRINLLTLFLIFGSLLLRSQTFTCGIDSVTDIDGNIYHTVLIGNQCWMKENVNTTRYANGLSVGMQEIMQDPEVREFINKPGNIQLMIRMQLSGYLNVVIYDLNGNIKCKEVLLCNSGEYHLDITFGPTQLYIITVNNITFKALGVDANDISIRLIQDYYLPRLKADTVYIDDSSRNYFDYDNDPANGPRLGKLYTFLSALNINYQPNQTLPTIIQGVCPNGWHVANDSDWVKLEMAAGMSPGQASIMFKYRGTIGNKLKITGTDYWLFGYGTDDFGFSAKGGGLYTCEIDCDFLFLKNIGNWWTYNEDYLMERALSDFQVGVWRSYYVAHHNAYSVRCVKNEEEH
jgi:uncharacterized protein (TIGR02145 family)